MFALIILIIGLLIGSFLNVVIYRLPRRESIAFPPSHCPHCRHKLAWYDLLPVISFISLKGKCRYCKQQISFIYPLVEVVTGIMFLSIYLFLPSTGMVFLVYLLIMTSVFITIFFTDFKYGIIPFQVVMVGVLTTVSYLLYSFSFFTITSHLLSSLSAFASFLFLFLITKGRGMGFGDVVLALLMGLFLGFPNIVFALYIAFLTGACISLILVLLGSKRFRHDTIPFGPFLVIGTFITVFYGNSILQIVKIFLVF